VEVIYQPVDVETFSGGAVGRGAAAARHRAQRVPRRDVRQNPPTHGPRDVPASWGAHRQKVPNLKLAVVGAAEAPEEVDYCCHLVALVGELGIADRLVWAGHGRTYRG
jgi:hypothetical protein